MRIILNQDFPTAIQHLEFSLRYGSLYYLALGVLLHINRSNDLHVMILTCFLSLDNYEDLSRHTDQFAMIIRL